MHSASRTDGAAAPGPRELSADRAARAGGGPAELAPARSEQRGPDLLMDDSLPRAVALLGSQNWVETS